ncbi:Gfo/Idh/MocA family protein [Microbacterium sp.]|uniref:Gfo/Idh/MocA family protein n=1 Tax=Microbacterium sp. TaxID=51671 RepID=UPI003A854661
MASPSGFPHVPGRVRVGIIGCGLIAINHVAALRTVADADVVAVADVDAARAEQFAATHDVPLAFGDIDALFGADIVDAVMVCTPHPAHEAGVLAAAAHGVHVMCEKPIAVTLESADRMIRACDEAGVVFGAIYQRRLWPAAQQIRAALDAGTLGRPISAQLTARFHRDADYYAEPWRGRWDTEGGGVLVTQTSHHIDLLQWLMDSDVTRVTGRYATLAHGDIIEVEDTAAAIVEFTSGALATVHVSTTFTPGLGAQLWFTDAQGRTAGLREFPEGVGLADEWTVPGVETFANPYQQGAFDVPLSEIHRELTRFHTLQIADFIAALREQRAPVVTGRDARRSLAIIAALYESSRTGRTVDVTVPEQVR